MPYYRIYKIDPDDHVSGVAQIIECADDDEAIQKTHQAINGYDVELWDQGRFIVRFSSPRK